MPFLGIDAALEEARGVGPGVDVRGADRDALTRNANGFLHQPAHLGNQGATHGDQIARHMGKDRLAIIEDQGAAVQVVVNALRGAGGKITGQRSPYRRRDHRLCRTDTQHLSLLVIREVLLKLRPPSSHRCP